MNKSEKIRQDRADYVKQRINKCTNTDREVKKLAKELFLSERTIEKDLKR